LNIPLPPVKKSNPQKNILVVIKENLIALAISALFVPDTVVMSGGIMKSIGLFMPAMQQAIATHNIMVPSSRVQVLPAKLGYHAGLIGAAYPIIKLMRSKK
jgi:predicted NBD/HSP70 family sugar kinase